MIGKLWENDGNFVVNGWKMMRNLLEMMGNDAKMLVNDGKRWYMRRSDGRIMPHDVLFGAKSPVRRVSGGLRSHPDVGITCFAPVKVVTW